MKKYIEPRIKNIMLDSGQAIMQVCMVGGAYFVGPSSPWTWCAKTAGEMWEITATCKEAIKEVSKLGYGPNSQDAQAS